MGIPSSKFSVKEQSSVKFVNLVTGKVVMELTDVKVEVSHSNEGTSINVTRPPAIS